MKRIICCCLLVFIQLFFIPQTLAGKDPIGWTVDGTLPNPFFVGKSHSLNYSFKNNLPFKMPTPLFISKQTLHPQDFFILDLCSGLKLAPNQTCTVHVDFDPETTGLKSLLLREEYGKNVVPLPKLTTTVQNGGNGGNGVIKGTVITALPKLTRVGFRYPVNLLFTNTSNQNIGGIQIIRSYPRGFSGSDNCTPTLNAGQSCNVTGTYSSTVPTAAHISLTMHYQGKIAFASTSTVVGNFGGNRIITFINKCGMDVWPAFAAGSVRGPGNAPISCTSSANCPTGSACNVNAQLCFWTGTPLAGGRNAPCAPNGSCPTGSSCQPNNFCYTNVICGLGPNPCPQNAVCGPNNYCYWTTPVPNRDAESAGGALNLKIPSGRSVSYFVPQGNPQDPNNIVWSGGVTGRLGCNAAISPYLCLVGDCTGNPASSAPVPPSSSGTITPPPSPYVRPGQLCKLGVGFLQPATEAEFTFVNNLGNPSDLNPPDFIDITNINGVSLPTSMGPSNMPPGTPPAGLYTCGTPGAYTPSPGLGSCSWNFSPPNYTSSFPQSKPNLLPSDYVWVANNYTNNTRSCVSDSDCTSLPGTVCGVEYWYNNTLSAANPPTTLLPFQKICGNLIGYWDAFQICSYLTSSNSSGPLYFNSPAFYNIQCNIQLLADVSTNLYKCTGGYGQSCYDIGAGSNCCGCIDWNTGPNALPAPPPPTPPASCQNYNPQAVQTSNTNALLDAFLFSAVTPASSQGILYPQIYFMKQACPTAYTYPFDDKTSQFTCSTYTTTGSSVNQVDYTVTFCPNRGHGGLYG